MLHVVADTPRLINAPATQAPRAAESEHVNAAAEPSRWSLVLANRMRAIVALARANQWPQMIDEIQTLAVVDIQKNQQSLLASGVEARQLAELYSTAFSALGFLPMPMKPRKDIARAGAAPIRLGIVTFQITDRQAAATSILAWVQRLDRARFTPVVLCCDELTQRRGETTIAKYEEKTSDAVGATIIAAIRAAGAEVHLVGPEGTWVDGIRRGIILARRLKLDAAMFIASPASPIQAAMMHARVAPVQINMNIGCPLPIDGCDAVMYHNNLRADADATTLASIGIPQYRVDTIGTDVSLCDRAPKLARAACGIPEDAVVLVCAASTLGPRMTRTTFLDDLLRFMRAEPSTFWVGVGGGVEIDTLKARFAEAGLIDRTLWTGPVPDTRMVLKVGDILLNEYPEGGGNTVLEAMGCGTPVVAMHAGPRHAECIGAILLGEHAVASPTVEAYWQRAGELVASRSLRVATGAALRARVSERFDYGPNVKVYEACIEELIAGKGAVRA